MAHHKSAKKRIRSSERKRERNKESLAKVRTLVKKVRSSKESDEAQVFLKEAVSYLDKCVSKGRIHKNNAARQKSSLTKYVNSLSESKG
jgi:small subunit ribosomal protein S20